VKGVRAVFVIYLLVIALGIAYAFAVAAAGR
jgi:hypothetical protein